MKIFIFVTKEEDIRLVVIILTCIDAILEGAAAAVLIAANVYCAGRSTLSALTGFNYCKTC